MCSLGAINKKRCAVMTEWDKYVLRQALLCRIDEVKETIRCYKEWDNLEDCELQDEYAELNTLHSLMDKFGLTNKYKLNRYNYEKHI